MRMTFLLSILVISITACSDQDHNTEPIEVRQETAAPDVPTSGDRDSWQRPQVLIGSMEEHLKDHTVAVLLEGDGYFTFKLLEAGANVIAIEADQENIAALEAQKKELGYSDQRLQIRHSPDGMPVLAPAEADVALMVHSYRTIEAPRKFFKRLREGMKEPRPLYLVEWMDRPTPIGPPQVERAPTQTIMEDLTRSGFASVGALGDKIPYQVLFFASDPIDMPMPE